MADSTDTQADQAPDTRPIDQPQIASFELTAGTFAMRGRAQATPAGLLSMGALVTGILLSTAFVVWVSKGVAHRHRKSER